MRGQHMILKAIVLLVVGTGLGTAQSYAHHAGGTEYDLTKVVTIQGTIMIVNLTNPHGVIYLNVKGPDGSAQKYTVHTVSGTSLNRMGVTKSSLPIGSTIVVQGWPGRDDSNKIAGQVVKTVDGKTIWAQDLTRVAR